MPSKKHSVTVHANAKKVCDFVSSMNNWAPLVPGYINHEIINQNVSTWEFKIDLGLIKKKVQLEVTILNWDEPSKVIFSLLGINEHFEGKGYFKVQRIDSSNSRMIGYLEMNSTGTFPSMTNNLIQPKLEEITEELTFNVCRKIESLS